MVKRGTNIKFIIEFISQNPGCNRRDAWKALLTHKGLDPNDRIHRGRFVSYFYDRPGLYKGAPHWEKYWIIDGNRMWLVVPNKPSDL